MQCIALIHCIALTNLLANVKEVMASHLLDDQHSVRVQDQIVAEHVQKSMDTVMHNVDENLVGHMLSSKLTESAFRETEMDDTTLRKPGHPAIPFECTCICSEAMDTSPECSMCCKQLLAETLNAQPGRLLKALVKPMKGADDKEKMVRCLNKALNLKPEKPQEVASANGRRTLADTRGGLPMSARGHFLESPDDAPQDKYNAEIRKALKENSHKGYEEMFPLEMKRIATATEEGHAKRGSYGFDAGSVKNMYGKVLHGYDRPVYGKTVEERLDIRSASKSDKFCKSR
eukprot:gnl/MRDRNA2_/MRDRNA2_163175_c0_seq1.p1 gnl/MRDRNA2_/MRDRNA2_163175_c0~~gnl/MRDRNA2_/MRDRNA2_163175_c0_seq1.p1  ORF type:complete len:288 (-),score=52.26 gnl/MRDRNA2_/MRDRNA2_163175_c0_seq1:42-905(-)